MASHRREWPALSETIAKAQAARTPGAKNHRPGRGQDRSKTEKFSQQVATSSKRNIASAIGQPHAKAQHPMAKRHLPMDTWPGRSRLSARNTNRVFWLFFEQL